MTSKNNESPVFELLDEYEGGDIYSYLDLILDVMNKSTESNWTAKEGNNHQTRH
ncbi:hypothetical protein M5C72_08525 [Companilactobacillus allii]|uniref:hypothetical protein n=1 Tax=Companilactobacillus allii TaxID=1847728 RepID=UPI0012FF6F9E|nr:hypothetical protein [Companilactobacillus allii]USQ67927.1 hypothetical protein M5C72_08525 [Companilactobacillus allii]